MTDKIDQSPAFEHGGVVIVRQWRRPLWDSMERTSRRWYIPPQVNRTISDAIPPFIQVSWLLAHGLPRFGAPSPGQLPAPE
jgi:hypothetical protein